MRASPTKSSQQRKNLWKAQSFKKKWYFKVTMRLWMWVAWKPLITPSSHFKTATTKKKKKKPVKLRKIVVPACSVKIKMATYPHWRDSNNWGIQIAQDLSVPYIPPPRFFQKAFIFSFKRSHMLTPVLGNQHSQLNVQGNGEGVRDVSIPDAYRSLHETKSCTITAPREDWRQTSEWSGCFGTLYGSTLPKCQQSMIGFLQSSPLFCGWSCPCRLYDCSKFSPPLLWKAYFSPPHWHRLPWWLRP